MGWHSIRPCFKTFCFSDKMNLLMMHRRSFVTAATAMAAASYNRVMGANDRVALGLIGSGRQGNADWKLFLGNPDVEPIAAADVYQTSLDNGITNSGGKATGYKDFRRLLERKDIDA